VEGSPRAENEAAVGNLGQRRWRVWAAGSVRAAHGAARGVLAVWRCGSARRGAATARGSRPRSFIGAGGAWRAAHARRGAARCPGQGQLGRNRG
jgi:hypothetical protein